MIYHIVGELITEHKHCSLRPFLIVPARNSHHVAEKIKELKHLGLPFIIICGEKVNHKRVVFRKNAGKWDAINFGFSLVPNEANIVVLNDVDTKIYNFSEALTILKSNIDLIYCKVEVEEGPQIKFYRLLNPIRRKIHIAASGELMAFKKEVFNNIKPIPPCLAEDSYILFKALQLGYRVKFCTSAYVITKRTTSHSEETKYKTRTTLGIYQALNKTKPPPSIRVFYLLLPLFAPILAFMGEDGRSWAKGISHAFRSHLKKNNASIF